MRFLLNIMFIMWLGIPSCFGIEPVWEFCKEEFVNNITGTLIRNCITSVQTKVPINCSCTVTQKSPQKMIEARCRCHSTVPKCSTGLEQTATDGKHMKTCDTRKSFSHSFDGLVFNLSITPEDWTSMSTDTFRVIVKRDSRTVMQVDFKPGTDENTTKLNVSSTSPTSASPSSNHTGTDENTTKLNVSSTSPTSASPSSNHTVVIVGVVVGIGLLMLLLISCLLCYIAGPCKIQRDKQQLPSQQPRRPPPRPNFLQRTLTLARDRIIQSRPLPKIPSAAKRQTLRTYPQSGYYDSIRSDFNDVKDNNNYPSIQECHINNKIHNAIINQVTQQSSVDSNSSYIHPSDVQVQHDDNDANTPGVVSTISDKVEQDNHYMHMRPAKGRNVADQETDDVYIQPSNTKPRQQGDETLAKNDTPISIDTDSFYVYSNNFRFPIGEARTEGSYINTKPSVENISQGPKFASKPKHENVEQCESDASALYLNDMCFSDYENVHCMKLSSNKRAGTDNESPYSNCVNEINQIIKHSVINSESYDSQNSDTYIPMNMGQTCVERAEEARNTDSQLNKDAQICDGNNIKESACETDSSVYMPMVGCRRNVDKQMLQKQDSTFPNLMSFKVHGASDQHNVDSTIMHPDAHLENVLKPNKNKLIRYVKEKRQS